MSPRLEIDLSPAFWAPLLVVALIFCGVLLVALCLKGDVFAELTLGRNSLKLAAKDKLAKK